MRVINTLRFSLGISWLICVTAPLVAQDLSAGQNAFNAAMANVHAVAIAGDRLALEKLAQQLQVEWSSKNPDEYGLLMQEIARLFASKLKDNAPPDFETARKYVYAALSHADAMQATTQINLAKSLISIELQGPIMKSGGEAWAQRRSDDGNLLLQTWKRVAGLVDPNWTPAGEPRMPAPPPDAIQLGGAVMADSIKDPQAKTDYLAAVGDFRKKLQNFVDQQELSSILPVFYNSIGSSIAYMYARPPSAQDELETLVGKYVPDPNERDKIIHASTQPAGTRPSNRGG